MRAYHARALTPLLKIKKNYFIRETISLALIKKKEGRATWRGELPLYVYVHRQAPKDDTQERVDGTENWNSQCAFVTRGEKERVKGGEGESNFLDTA